MTIRCGADFEITLRQFRHYRRGVKNAYAFSAGGFGRRKRWPGRTVHLDPLESDGHVSVKRQTQHVLAESARSISIRHPEQAVLVDAVLHFDTSAAPVNLQVNEGKFLLSDFRLSAAGSVIRS
ncbi:MAG: hypothetical protein IPO99_18465 [Nitrospira sp.]|nr:hypothetical protein [Nitrospira sp.]